MSLAQKLLKIDAFTKTKDDVRIKTRSGGLITLMLLLTSIILIINEWKMFNTIQIIPSLVVDRDRNKKMNMFVDIDFLNMPCDYLYLDVMDESGEIQLDLTGTENCEKIPLSENSCKVKGNIYLNRLQGHFHFAPGKPFQNPVTGQHSHDIQEYENKNFDHKINKITFEYDQDLMTNNDNKLIQSFFEESINQVISEPLTGTEVLDNNAFRQYSYFLKIVPTRFEDLTKRSEPNRHKNELLLDGTSLDSKISKVEKIQYTATTHSKPLHGGRDEDHPNTLHQRGGIPGIFFVFDISSLKIINKLQYRMNWYGFTLNLLSSLGGIFALYTVLDKVAYKTINYYRTKKDQ